MSDNVWAGKEVGRGMEGVGEGGDEEVVVRERMVGGMGCGIEVGGKEEV